MQKNAKITAHKAATATTAAAAATKTISLKERQIVLHTETLIANALATRNKINLAFAKKGQKHPVVASLTKSLKSNTVVTTTEAFTGQFLLEHKAI